MAYPTTDNYFKKYRREQRIQSVEEPFNLGMQVTNAPLNTGASRLLVNFDLKDSGEVLIPRPALQTTQISGQNSTGTDTLIINGKTSPENNLTYEQTLTGDGEYIRPITITPDESSFYLTQLVGTAKKSKYITPSSASIHDINISDTSPMAYNVGTFGFNNSYYCFNAETNKLMQTKYTTDRFQFEDLDSKAITPKEAVMWGYNMLQTNAYTFTDETAQGTVQLLGLLPYNADGDLALNAKLNETVTLRCFYAGPANTYNIKWEWKELMGSEWTTITEMTNKSLSGLPALTTKLSLPAEQLFVRISFTKVVDGTAEDNVEQVLTVSFDLTQDAKATLNLKPINYDLHTAKGMTYWKNRLIVYGVPKDETVLFTSAVNDPTYFPYPNGADIFDEPIVKVMPFLDKLLVFTTTQLHMLTLSEDGLSWTRKQIQSNLNISSWDTHLIVQVKNMVFFKSGNYYYMVVPSLKTGDLVVTNVSKNIENFFDNFKENIIEILSIIYDYNQDFELIHYYNFLDFEDVYNMYVFKTVDDIYINVAIIYNTISRYWRIYTFESEKILKAYKQDITKRGTFATTLNGGVQFLKFNKLDAKDYYYDETYTRVNPMFRNYQLIDTGYRNISTDYMKRYREYQMKFNNISQRTLTFATDFYIDGELRQDMYDYKVKHILDPNDSKYLNIVIEKEFKPRLTLPGDTMLAAQSTEDSKWLLSTSGFPEMSLYKIRVPISGKGLSPRMRFASYNEELFEILNIVWVYRKLYSR